MNNMKIESEKETIEKPGNYIYMLVGLLTLIVIGPVLSKHYPEVSRLVMQWAFASVMFIGIWSLNISRFWFRLGMGLILTALTLSIVSFFIQSKLIFLTGLASSLLFLIFSTNIAIKHILFSGKITFNKIVGSLCIYLLIGLLWGLLYVFIAVIHPESFHDELALKEYSQMWDYLYFSFITLTTLGYGDITPSLPFVRTLAYLEAICGQFYMAILVASLVGAYLTDHNQNNDGK